MYEEDYANKQIRNLARMDTVKQASEKKKVMHQKVQEYYAV